MEPTEKRPVGRPRGYRDPRYSTDSLRYTGWRPPLIAGELGGLVDAIAQARNLSKRETVEQALLAYATAKELEAAGLGHHRGSAEADDEQAGQATATGQEAD